MGPMDQGPIQKTTAMNLIRVIPRKGAGTVPCAIIGYVVTAPRALTRAIRTLPTHWAAKIFVIPNTVTA